MPQTLTLPTQHSDVMVVDSRPEDFGRLAASDAARGMRFQFATTVSDALKLRRGAGRSIWLINVDLPDGSGCDLAVAIRNREPRGVVYLISDQYDPAEELSARMAGGAMYLCKPAETTWLSLVSSLPQLV